MKDILAIFVVGFFTISFAIGGYAQTTMIGARVGVDLANQEYENLPTGMTTSWKPGILVGGQLDHWFNHSWALSVQLLYDQKGVHSDMNGYASPVNGLSSLGTSISTADWTISYLEVPLLAKLSFGHGTLRPYIFAGPSIGFLLSNREKLHQIGTYNFPYGVGANYTIDTTANITDSTAKIDISIIVGAGISVALSSGIALFADAAYAFGLTNIDKYYEDSENDIYIHSRDIRIAAGVLFTIN
jgi:hypothetical protein